MDTDHKRPVYTFYHFSFSFEAGGLLLSLKLDNLNPIFYTHTHLSNGQVIDSSHNNYIFYLSKVFIIYGAALFPFGENIK